MILKPEYLSRRGFHSTCILKTVCEMAQHSLHHHDSDLDDEEDENILTKILHFIFT